MSRTPIHPGSILADELDEFGIRAAEAARILSVPANRLSQIIAGQRSVTADTALRLGQWLDTGPEFWLSLQKTYELDLARARLGDALARTPSRAMTPPPAAA